MKLIKLSNKLLKYMVSEYHETSKELFMISDFQDAFSEAAPEHISGALRMLEDDGFILLRSFDGQIYSISLHMSAVRSVEESTLFSKFYKFLKEVRSWF